MPVPSVSLIQMAVPSVSLMQMAVPSVSLMQMVGLSVSLMQMAGLSVSEILGAGPLASQTQEAALYISATMVVDPSARLVAEAKEVALSLCWSALSVEQWMRQDATNHVWKVGC